MLPPCRPTAYAPGAVTARVDRVRRAHVRPTSAQYSLTIRVRIDHKPGHARAGGERDRRGGRHDRRGRPRRRRRASTRCATSPSTPPATSTASAIVAAIDAVDGARSSTRPTAPSCCTSAARSSSTTSRRCKTRDDLSMAYTPGVARVCMAIAEDRDKAFQYTIKRNTVAVVSDGTAVLGLGDIGPEAAMPVMEGKAMLFKEFAGVDAFPICLDTKDPDEIVETVERDRADLRRHQPRGHLGAALLRDRGAPEGVARHPRLPRRPARHRGRRARRAAQRLQADRPRLADLRVLVVGLGAAGVAVSKILLAAGVRDIVGCDSRGALHTERDDYLDGSMHADQALVRRGHQPRAAARARPADVIDGMRPLHRPLGRARHARRGAGADERATRWSSRWPTRTPRSRPRRPRLRAHHRHRAARTTRTRSTTSSASPGIFRGALDVRARADHREDEDGRRARRSPRSSPTTSCARTTSSPRSSTATSPRPWPPRSPTRPGRGPGHRRRARDRLRGGRVPG